MKTRHLQLVTHTHSVTTTSRSNVYSPFGPLNQDSTTWRVREIQRENQYQQLMELLNSLESVVANLNYKSFTVLDTLEQGTKAIRAQHFDFINDTIGTNLL